MNIHWLKQLIAKSFLDFTLLIAAHALVGLFGTVCAMLKIST